MHTVSWPSVAVDCKPCSITARSGRLRILNMQWLLQAKIWHFLSNLIKCCYCQLFLCDKPHGSPYSTFWWGFLWFQLETTSQMCKPLSYEATKLPILYICTLFLTIPHSDQHPSPCCGGSSLNRGVQTSFSLAYSFSLSEWTHRCSLQCVLLSLLPEGHPQKT